MLHNIAGIKFKGAAFNIDTTFQFFSDETDRVSLIFGRNGSGKSTVSRAISKASGKVEIEDIVSAEFVNSSNSVVTVPENEMGKIFVFNEDYTNSNVRIKEDGLNAIVMFGESGEIADKLEKTEKLLAEAERRYTEQNAKYIQYEDRNNVLSPEHFRNQLLGALRGDTKWAGRERVITKNLRQNASVNDSTIEEIMRISPDKTQDEVQISYSSKLTELKNAENSKGEIATTISTIDVQIYRAQVLDIAELLAKKIEKPSLSEREQKLLIMAQEGQQSRLSEIKTEFSGDTKTCPFCLQEVSDNYKKDLITSIEKVLSKATEEHATSLKKSEIHPISRDFLPFEILDGEFFKKCQNTLTSVNTEIEKCNQALQRKVDNLYTPITDFRSDLQSKIEDLNVLLVELDQKKNQYNERQKDLPQIRNDLKALNKQLAYYEIKNIHDDYTHQLEEKEREKEKLENRKNDLEIKREETSSLKLQMKNVKIAANLINDSLKYVFFSEDRLAVELRGEDYVLKSNGKEVKPKNVSVGERNILSLCYFFTELLSNVDVKDIHKSECLIVLDDPVSSFDLDNRVGIISYIKSQIIKLLRGNPDSKVLFLSHDLLTVSDMEKAIQEISRQINVTLSNGNHHQMTHKSVFELCKGNSSKLKIDKRNEYSEMLQATYKYAVDEFDDYGIVIGNIMRRMLEAFSTFEYRKSIDAISCDLKILEKIDKNKRGYFENLMYRLVLNGESHLEERTRSLTDPNFFASITEAEKKRTAKDVLCLLYLLNEDHIISHLTALNDKAGLDSVAMIQGWLATI